MINMSIEIQQSLMEGSDDALLSLRLTLRPQRLYHRSWPTRLELSVTDTTDMMNPTIPYSRTCQAAQHVQEKWVLCLLCYDILSLGIIPSYTLSMLFRPYIHPYP